MKKPKTYNLKRNIYETINKLATADGRSDSDWLNIHLGNTLPNKGMSKPKTSLVKSEPKFNFKSELLALGADKKKVSDWLIVRKTKKASNTETAFTGFLTEVEKAGITVADAVKMAAESSWAGFKATWYVNAKQLNDKDADIRAISSASDWHKQDQGF